MHKNGLVKAISIVLLVTALAAGLVACSQTESTPSSTPKPSPSAAPTASPTPTANTSPIIMVWYPNESASDYEPARNEFGRIMAEATGRPVEHKLTTDYAIAIEALASGSADVCFMGAAGYIEAKNKNPEVGPLFVNSGASGTLDDAIYYSWMAVNKGTEDAYKDGDKYAIDNIQGKRMSFVSNSSTSGFKVPTTGIIDHFKTTGQWANITVDDLVEGGSNKFFSEVLFGGSHQGSAFNLLSGKCDVAAFCDTEFAPYGGLKEGEENKAGAVYAVKEGASAPFDTVIGKEFVVIRSTPVLNGPFAYNPENFSDEEIQSIRDAFTSDEVASNPQIFVVKDSGYVGMFKKTADERIVLVDDSWYDPIRTMGN